ncbi:hypothetical protein C8R47DRAFT_1230945 [Mycena vitilis]|nr:hypothetical protein C8R47DRAFT_1230945 [Mycena vitilis]
MFRTDRIAEDKQVEGKDAGETCQSDLRGRLREVCAYEEGGWKCTRHLLPRSSAPTRCCTFSSASSPEIANSAESLSIAGGGLRGPDAPSSEPREKGKGMCFEERIVSQYTGVCAQKTSSASGLLPAYVRTRSFSTHAFFLIYPAIEKHEDSEHEQDGQSLIDFDERRFAAATSARKGNHREDVTRKAFECLDNMEKGAEEAQREGSSGPFQKTISQQIEKNRRDRLIRARLQKERVQEQTKNEKREDLLNKAMRKQLPTPQQKHQRGKKSMSAFLHFTCPISMGRLWQREPMLLA